MLTIESLFFSLVHVHSASPTWLRPWVRVPKAPQDALLPQEPWHLSTTAGKILIVQSPEHASVNPECKISHEELGCIILWRAHQVQVLKE